MITGSERNSLINYRLKQSFDTIELVQFLIASEKLTVAVNRIYYGMYYALTALAIKYQYETSKHQQLISWFNKEFVATKLVDTEYGKILRNAYQSRRKGDYDAFVVFEKEEVEMMLSDLKKFFQEIERLVRNHDNLK